MIKEVLYYFEGLDQSIVKLNPYISDNDFEFVKYDLNEFQKKFIDLFNGEKDDSIVTMTINNQVEFENLSGSFLDSIRQSRYFNNKEIFNDKYIIFLKDIYLSESNFIEDDEELIEEENVENNFLVEPRLNELISKLKLLKSGHLKLISSFKIFEGFKYIFSEGYAYPSKFIALAKYTIQDTNLPLVSKHFSETHKLPSYLELAFNSFLEYYDIENNKIKFIILMISLESIFNKSSQDPIQHIISRHVAILLTIQKNEKSKADLLKEAFNKAYSNVKKLYNIRSAIVHGKKEKDDKEYKKFLENSTPYILELEEIVRKVLQQLIWIHDFDLNMPKDKEELFNYLNVKGFPG